MLGGNSNGWPISRDRHWFSSNPLNFSGPSRKGEAISRLENDTKEPKDRERGSIHLARMPPCCDWKLDFSRTSKIKP
jgi:hypothetical protein